MAGYIANIRSINKIVEEILYLEKSREDLKTYAINYVQLIESKKECLIHYPQIRQEVEVSLHKQNFNIANANEKINVFQNTIKKLEYINSSIKGYDTVTDSLLRKEVDLEQFISNIKKEQNTVTFLNVDILYNQVVNKYHEINSKSSQLGDVRGKYNQLSQLIDSNKSYISSFPKVEIELTSFVQSKQYNENKVNYYLQSFGNNINTLKSFITQINTLNSIPTNDLKALNQSSVSFLNNLKNGITYDTIDTNSDPTQRHSESIKNTISQLSDIRNKFQSLKSNYSLNKNNLFSEDNNHLISHISQIENKLSSQLDNSFTSINSLLSNLNHYLNESVKKFSNRISECTTLSQRLERVKHNIWLEQYNDIHSKIARLKSNQGNENYRGINSEIDKSINEKDNQINNFINNNLFLLTKTNKLNQFTMNIRDAQVSFSVFKKFEQELLKNKGLKTAYYKVIELLSRFFTFLFKKKTLKVIGIVIGVLILVAILTMYWKIIFGIAFIIGIISIIIKSKK